MLQNKNAMHNQLQIKKRYIVHNQWSNSVKQHMPITSQEALHHAMCHKYNISHMKRLAIGNDLQGHSRSLQKLLLDRP